MFHELINVSDLVHNMRLYRNLFFVMGIPFGIVMGLFFELDQDPVYGIIAAIVGGSLFGLAMSLLIGTMHRMYSRHLELEGKESDDLSFHTHSETIALPFDVIFEKALKALEQLNAQVITSNDIDGFISAKTSINWKSFGEHIDITLSRCGEKKTHVVVSSRPRVRPSTLDYGRGLQNVSAFMHALKT